MKKRSKLFITLLLQGTIILFALSNVAGKFASKYDFLSASYIMCYLIEIFLLGIYAIVWQQIIKNTEISIAYLNKATTIFWSLLFAAIFFSEKISITNIIGSIIIFIGIWMVNKNE